MSEEIRHFSLRKLSIGLASVLVDIQHLLALSFGYTNLDPDPNNPWKRNETGSEQYLKFDTLSNPTAKHNIQPKYLIDKVVYVQSIVKNSIKGRHLDSSLTIRHRTMFIKYQDSMEAGRPMRRFTIRSYC